jgi:hypothetical protein
LRPDLRHCGDAGPGRDRIHAVRDRGTALRPGARLLRSRAGVLAGGSGGAAPARIADRALFTTTPFSSSCRSGLAKSYV